MLPFPGYLPPAHDISRLGLYAPASSDQSYPPILQTNSSSMTTHVPSRTSPTSAGSAFCSRENLEPSSDAPINRDDQIKQLKDDQIQQLKDDQIKQLMQQNFIMEKKMKELLKEKELLEKEKELSKRHGSQTQSISTPSVSI